MSTVFACPCPLCDQRMEVRPDGDVECTSCAARYHARMGYLLPLPRQASALLNGAGSDAEPGRPRVHDRPEPDA
jgi:hypothetical protein